MQVPRKFGSFCALWNWIRDLAVERHGPELDNIQYITLNDAETTTVMEPIRATCNRLQASALFGPDDDELVAANSTGQILKSGFGGSRPAMPSEIRLARILQQSERYIIQKAEICPGWIKPFPSKPVNSISELADYLRTEMEAWSTATVGASDRVRAAEVDAVNCQWRVLGNVRESLAWFHEQELISTVPDAPIGAKTLITAARYAAYLERWLDEITPIVCAPSRDAGATSSPKCVVELRGRSQKPLVFGHEEPVLSDAQYDALEALINAGENGLSGKDLKKASGHGGAVNTVKDLHKVVKGGWPQAILPARKAHGKYRLMHK